MQRRVPSEVFRTKGLASLCLTLAFIFPALAFAELFYYRAPNGTICLTNIPTNHVIWQKEKRTPHKKHLDKELFEKVGFHFGLDPELLKAVAKAESNFDPYAISPKGAKGLMQLMPPTAKDYGVRDIFDPEENLWAAAAYLKDLLEEFGDLRLALAAYNAGPAKVRKYQGIPPYHETKSYVNKVLQTYFFYQKQKNSIFFSSRP